MWNAARVSVGATIVARARRYHVTLSAELDTLNQLTANTANEREVSKYKITFFRTEIDILFSAIKLAKLRQQRRWNKFICCISSIRVHAFCKIVYGFM